MVEQRGANFPEVSDHIMSSEAKGQRPSLEKNRIYYEIKRLGNHTNKKQETSECGAFHAPLDKVIPYP